MRHTKYRIGVLTNLLGPSMNDLMAMADKNGVVFEQISYPAIPLAGFHSSELIRHICSYDIVYYRTGMQGSVITELAKILEEKNIPCINGTLTHPFIHKKIRQALIADRYNILQPKSFVMNSLNYEDISSVLGPSFVVKPDIGSKGIDVTLINSKTELDTFITTKTKKVYLCQEYLDNAEEYRVYVVGQKGVATYKKISHGSDFRANLHAGGSMEETEVKMNKPLIKFGEEIAQHFGVDICGIDILVKNDQLYFLELNLQPGWENLEEITGTNLCRETIQYTLDRAHKSKPWYKRLGK